MVPCGTTWKLWCDVGVPCGTTWYHVVLLHMEYHVVLLHIHFNFQYDVGEYWKENIGTSHISFVTTHIFNSHFPKSHISFVTTHIFPSLTFWCDVGEYWKLKCMWKFRVNDVGEIWGCDDSYIYITPQLPTSHHTCTPTSHLHHTDMLSTPPPLLHVMSRYHI